MGGVEAGARGGRRIGGGSSRAAAFRLVLQPTGWCLGCGRTFGIWWRNWSLETSNDDMLGLTLDLPSKAKISPSKILYYTTKMPCEWNIDGEFRADLAVLKSLSTSGIRIGYLAYVIPWYLSHSQSDNMPVLENESIQETCKIS